MDAKLKKNKSNFVPLTPLSFLYRTKNIFPKRIAWIYGKRKATYCEFYKRCKMLALALKNNKIKRGRRSKFKSLIIEKDFEPEDPKQLEELDENSCKWPIGHPDEKGFYFCGRTSLKDFSYCKLHLLYAYQPKGKKEDFVDKEEIPEFIGKKIKSA